MSIGLFGVRKKVKKTVETKRLCSTVYRVAGVVRIELTPKESEAFVLPLHHTPATSPILYHFF